MIVELLMVDLNTLNEMGWKLQLGSFFFWRLIDEI